MFFFSLQYIFLRTFRYNNEYISVSEGDMAANKKKKLGKAKPVADFSHPLLVTSLKGHAGEVTSFDISSTSKYLISTATGNLSITLNKMKKYSSYESELKGLCVEVYFLCNFAYFIGI